VESTTDKEEVVADELTDRSTKEFVSITAESAAGMEYAEGG
jgi:hypothetical protein